MTCGLSCKRRRYSPKLSYLKSDVSRPRISFFLCAICMFADNVGRAGPSTGVLPSKECIVVGKCGRPCMGIRVVWFLPSCSGFILPPYSIRLTHDYLEKM